MKTSEKARIIREAERAGLLEDYAGSISIRRVAEMDPAAWEILEGDALIELLIEMAQYIHELETHGTPEAPPF